VERGLAPTITGKKGLYPWGTSHRIKCHGWEPTQTSGRLRALWGSLSLPQGCGSLGCSTQKQHQTAFFRPWQQKIDHCSRIPDPPPGPKREPSRSAGLTQGIRFVLHRVVHLPGHPGHCLAHLLLHAGARFRWGHVLAGGIHCWRQKSATLASRERDAKNNRRDQHSQGREGGCAAAGMALSI